MRFIFELGDVQEGGLNFSWMGSGEKLTREGDSLFFRESLRLRIHLEKNKEQVLVEGELSTVLDLTCSRCLINYPFAVKEEIFALFISQEKALSLSEEKELGAEEFNINYYSGDSLELTEVLRDQLLLSIPMTHRCKEECLGLCPSCGQNWNQGSCDCPRGDKTSPFETLKKLKL